MEKSCKAHRMKSSALELKILMNTQLGVICTNMVDFANLLSYLLLWPLVGGHQNMRSLFS